MCSCVKAREWDGGEYLTGCSKCGCVRIGCVQSAGGGRKGGERGIGRASIYERGFCCMFSVEPVVCRTTNVKKYKKGGKEANVLNV